MGTDAFSFAHETEEQVAGTDFSGAEPQRLTE
jgi:hypothetical protein